MGDCYQVPLTTAFSGSRGAISPHTLPSGHQGILPNDVRAFLERHELPMLGASLLENAVRWRILIVNDESDAVRAITEALSRDNDGIEMASVQDGCEAGILVLAPFAGPANVERILLRRQAA